MRKTLFGDAKRFELSLPPKLKFMSTKAACYHLHYASVVWNRFYAANISIFFYINKISCNNLMFYLNMLSYVLFTVYSTALLTASALAALYILLNLV